MRAGQRQCATVSSVVATGRLMNGAEMLIESAGITARLHRLPAVDCPPDGSAKLATQAASAPEPQINDRRREQSQHLADDQTADDA